MEQLNSPVIVLDRLWRRIAIQMRFRTEETASLRMSHVRFLPPFRLSSEIQDLNDLNLKILRDGSDQSALLHSQGRYHGSNLSNLGDSKELIASRGFGWVDALFVCEAKLEGTAKKRTPFLKGQN